MTDIDERLVAYADGELDAENARAVERLLASDPEARRKLEIFRATAALLREACRDADGRAAAPPRHVVSRKTLPQRRRVLLGGAALAACAAGLGAFLLRPDPRGDFVDEIAEYHKVFSRETTHLAEVPAQQSPELLAWFGERVGGRLVVPDLASSGLRFAGGRMLVVDGEPVAQFMYRRASGGPVGVCVGRSDAAAAGIRVDRRGDLRLASWLDGSHIYVVVGEFDPGAARRLAEQVAMQFRA